MSTAGRIKRHIACQKHNALFTTRDLLVYGPRAYIDNLLCRMVKGGQIQRVARGVFCRSQDAVFSAYEIAVVKAQAFGRTVFHQANQGQEGAESEEEGVIARSANARGRQNKQLAENCFPIDGRSSSFWSVAGRIQLRHLNCRLRALGHTLAGRTLAALWRRKRQSCDEHTVVQAVAQFGRGDKEQTRALLGRLPHWLHTYFCPPVQRAVSRKFAYDDCHKTETVAIRVAPFKLNENG